jgi:NAD(P)-dependent dehydrogenase (short-subunit alcohol dehydrogenase family)
MGKRLENKVAVIFGGAGRIGSSAAEAFWSEGASLALIDKNSEKLATIKQRLLKGGREDQRCIAIESNIESESDARTVSQKLIEIFGKIDILLNCPAYIFRAPFLDHPVEELDRQWHVNVRLVFIFSQAIARVMKDGGGGKIINMASIGAKAGIIAISRVMALELAQFNIQVNVVAPGPTETVPFSSPFYLQHPEVLQRIESRTPAGRIGHPEDHTGLLVFLACKESDWITGQVILSDGGLSLV